MTIQEYLERNHMTYTALAKLVGCSVYTIARIAKFDKTVKDLNHLRRFKELGIEVRTYDPKLNKEREVSYLYYEKLQIGSEKKDDIYCYTLDKLNAVTQYLNEKRICYYVVVKKDYWLVKYDRTIREEEWLQ